MQTAEATLCSLVAVRGLLANCGGFFGCRARAQGAQASVGAAHGLWSCDSQAVEHGLSNCGVWA